MVIRCQRHRALVREMEFIGNADTDDIDIMPIQFQVACTSAKAGFCPVANVLKLFPLEADAKIVRRGKFEAEANYRINPAVIPRAGEAGFGII